jgi:hypothetical protein
LKLRTTKVSCRVSRTSLAKMALSLGSCQPLDRGQLVQENEDEFAADCDVAEVDVLPRFLVVVADESAVAAGGEREPAG